MASPAPPVTPQLRRVRASTAQSVGSTTSTASIVRPRKRYLVATALDKYGAYGNELGIGDLPYCNKDTQQFVDKATSIGFELVALLCDEVRQLHYCHQNVLLSLCSPTSHSRACVWYCHCIAQECDKYSLADSIEEACSKAEDGDIVTIYLSQHGVDISGAINVVCYPDKATGLSAVPEIGSKDWVSTRAHTRTHTMRTLQTNATHLTTPALAERRSEAASSRCQGIDNRVCSRQEHHGHCARRHMP